MKLRRNRGAIGFCVSWALVWGGCAGVAATPVQRTESLVSCAQHRVIIQSARGDVRNMITPRVGLCSAQILGVHSEVDTQGSVCATGTPHQLSSTSCSTVRQFETRTSEEATPVYNRQVASAGPCLVESVAQSWADDVVAAVVASDVPALSALARRALRTSPPALELWNSGAGYLIGESHLWQCLPAAAAADRRLAADRWKAAASGFKKPKGLHQTPHPLPGGHRKFTASVDRLSEEIAAHTEKEPPHVIREAASVMVVSHFYHVEKLHCAEDTDFRVASKKPAVRALLRRLREVAGDISEERFAKQRKERHFTELAGACAPPSASALDAAESCSRQSTDAADLEIEEALQEAGLLAAETEAPMARISKWAQARANGVNVLSLLDKKRKQLLVEPVRNSAQQLASGLRAWHLFCVMVLGYSANASLPPASAEHVILFMLMFKNGSTASNYVTHILNGCRAVGLSCTWHDGDVAQAKVAARLRSQRLLVLPAEAPVMQWSWVKLLVCFCDDAGRRLEATLYLVFWSFLLRVPSEGLGLEFGCAADLLGLPAGRHSALAVVGEVAGLRLAKRKHRPRGSLLQRPCTCSSSVSPQFCVVHRLKQLAGTVGTQLSTRTAYEVLRTLRQDLTSVGVKAAKLVTLKGFRAGMASHMAANKEPLGKILAFGEWKSSALLAYISETAVDSLKIIQNEIAQELEEDD